MREFKGTKGEWFADGYDIFAEDGKYHVCKISSDLDDSVEEANAELIAAAPELLEALQGLFDICKQLADSGDAGFWALEDSDIGKKSITAINKALGVK